MLSTMKQSIATLTLLAALLIGCNSSKSTDDIAKVETDSLIAHVDKYHNTSVEVEGTVVHICGVDGKKMKLKTAGGASIKVVYTDSLMRFDTAFYNKRVRVLGVLKETRLYKPYIDSMEKSKAAPCSIDSKPCIDSLWIKNKRESGAIDSISRVGIEKLRERMAQAGKDYISVITIVAEKVEVIN